MWTWRKRCESAGAQLLYAGGVRKPPTRSARSAANSMDVPSSHIGATIWMPAGRPSRVLPIGATVAGNPDKLAKAVQYPIRSMDCLPLDVWTVRFSAGVL